MVPQTGCDDYRHFLQNAEYNKFVLFPYLNFILIQVAKGTCPHSVGETLVALSKLLSLEPPVYHCFCHPDFTQRRKAAGSLP